VQIYLAPTADSRETWQAALRHIACEGRCFVLGCNQFVARRDLPTDGSICLPGLEELAGAPEIVCRGGSAIISPLGEVIAGPLYDRAGILIADLDLAQTVEGKFDFDVAGHYARPDVFRLIVDERPQPPVVWRTETPGDRGFVVSSAERSRLKGRRRIAPRRGPKFIRPGSEHPCIHSNVSSATSRPTGNRWR
jgi:hypothetical protein